MRDFTASAGRLRILSVPAKLLYSAFAFSALLGLLVSWQLYGEMVGDAGAVAYYAGAPVAVPESAQAGEGGPVLDIPVEASEPRLMVEQVSSRKLLEVTHFHLFSIPVYVLILAHLWVLARLPVWLHGAGVVAAIATSGLHMAAPWLVRGAPSAAWLMPVSGAAMLVVLGTMCIVPTVDMWLAPVRRGPRGGEPDEA